MFKDPDWQIQYSCAALEDTAGILAIARTIVHESWHSTAAPNHVDGTTTPNYSGPANNSCRNGAQRCDTFIWDAISSARKYAGLVQQQWEGVGAYQVEQEFTCDLVEAGADWLPLQTQLVANEYFHVRANLSRFVNPELADIDGNPATLDSGQLPYTCGAPETVLAVPSDGMSICPGTLQLRCNVDADCNDGDPVSLDACVNFCCSNIVVK